MFKIKKSAVILVAAFYLAAYTSGGKIPYLIFYLIMGAFLLSFLWCFFIKERINGYQRFEEKDYFVGDEVEIQSFIDNDTLLPVPHIEITDRTVEAVSDKKPTTSVFSLLPLERELAEEDIKAEYRGIYDIGPMEIKISDIFGIFTWYRKIYTNINLKIYPRVHDLDFFNLKSMQSYGTLTTKQKAYEDNTSISEIRKYTAGDSVKKIHWKVSAKKGSLFVKNFEMTGSASAYIFLDFKRNCYSGGNIRELEEKAVEVVASIASYFLKNAVSINMYVNSSKLYYTTGRDTKKLKNFLEILCEIKSDGNKSMEDILEKRIRLIAKGSSIIVVTGDITDKNIDMYYSIKKMGYDLILVFVSNNKIDDDLNNKINAYDIKIYSVNSNSNIKVVLESI